MIRKLSAGGYRLYSRKANPRTGRRRNLGTFSTRAAAERHERAVQYFKQAGGAAEGLRPPATWPGQVWTRGSSLGTINPRVAAW